jgi:hypothetical protein
VRVDVGELAGFDRKRPPLGHATEHSFNSAPFSDRIGQEIEFHCWDIATNNLSKVISIPNSIRSNGSNFGKRLAGYL